MRYKATSSAAVSQRTVMSLPEKLVTLRSDGDGTFTGVREKDVRREHAAFDLRISMCVLRVVTLPVRAVDRPWG